MQSINCRIIIVLSDQIWFPTAEGWLYWWPGGTRQEVETPPCEKRQRAGSAFVVTTLWTSRLIPTRSCTYIERGQTHGPKCASIHPSIEVWNFLPMTDFSPPIYRWLRWQICGMVVCAIWFLLLYVFKSVKISFITEGCFWSYWTIVTFRPLKVEIHRSTALVDGFHTKSIIEQ